MNDTAGTSLIRDVPHAPGVYLMRDRLGAIIYVGKALDLNKRVRSYFADRGLPPKIAVLISNIARLDYIVAAHEQEALVLENKLIKQYQPRYNTLLRDDKTYPFLVLTVREDFPRLFLTRRKKKDGNVYFGPFPFVRQLRALTVWLARNFMLRPCKEKLFEDIAQNKKTFGSCLYLHIKSCPAPCAGKISAREYRKGVEKLKLFLGGKHGDLLALWKREMKQASKKLDFELAAQIRDRIEGLERFYDRVRIRRIQESGLSSVIEKTRALSELKKDLNLPKVPLTIEAFDISNIGGELAVGSMVRFKNGTPDKRNYRLYKIRTVSGADDPRMIAEIVTRRFRRLLADRDKLPDLVLIDGGKAQLGAARDALAALSLDTQPVISLAKQNEEIFFPESAVPLVLEKSRESLSLLRYIRDESHRFAISFYRKRHRKKLLSGS